MESLSPRLDNRATKSPTFDGAQQLPLVALQAALAELPAGPGVSTATSDELHQALLALARHDAGETRDLSGLAAWLDFLRDPWQDDAPLDADDRPTPADRDLGRLIGAALDHVRGNPDPPEDSLAALGAILEARGKGVALAFHRDATPPFDKFQKLLQERAFARTWDHKHPDLAGAPVEAYEAALADHAVVAGWTDQEICDLLIAHRQRWLEDPVPDTSIISDARRRAGHTMPPPPAAPRPKLVVVEPKPDSTSTPAERAAALDALNRALGIDLAAVVQYGPGGRFELQFRDGRRADLGESDRLLNQRHARAAILDATRRLIPAYKTVLWDKVVERIVQAAGEVPAEEAPELVEMRWLIQSRLAHVTILDIDERDRAAVAQIIREDIDKTGHWAFRNQDGRYRIILGGLLAAVRLNHGILMTFKDAGTRLRKLGWKPRDMDGQDDQGRVCRNAWISPAGAGG